mgnify:CR=1 FL=1
MYAKANYTEPCVCGNPLEQVTKSFISIFKFLPVYIFKIIILVKKPM